MRREPAQAGVTVVISTLHRCSVRHGITRKKDRSYRGIGPLRLPTKREAWFEGQLDLDPERLCFIDETWTATNVTHSHGRCCRGERRQIGYLYDHRKITALVAGLRITGVVAPMVLDGPING